MSWAVYLVSFNLFANYNVLPHVQPWNHLPKKICKKTSTQHTQHPTVSFEWQEFNFSDMWHFDLILLNNLTYFPSLRSVASRWALDAQTRNAR